MQKTRSISEIRFYEGKGEQYLKNNRVRCQATSAAATRRVREETGDYESDSSTFWPKNQCGLVAVDGTFLCKFHGGAKQALYKREDSYLGVFPTDIAERIKTLQKNPDYLSRADDINLMRARIMQLGERLLSSQESEEAWGEVSNALAALNRGEIVQATELLERSLNYHDVELETWDEIHKTENTLTTLTNTQMKTMKELRLMASYEQVLRLTGAIYEIIQTAADTYITDGSSRTQFGNHVAHKFQQLIGSSVDRFGREVVSVEYSDDRDSE